MKNFLAVAICLLLLFIAGCTEGPDSPRGFSLPKGDAAKGEQVFKQFGCLACHRLKGYEEHDVKQEIETLVTLGGTELRVKTYADLVTSIINPSHKISQRVAADKVTDENGKSKMRVYNDVMTVTQLVDLVTFLETQYSVQPYVPTRYIM